MNAQGDTLMLLTVLTVVAFAIGVYAWLVFA